MSDRVTLTHRTSSGAPVTSSPPSTISAGVAVTGKTAAVSRTPPASPVEGNVVRTTPGSLSRPRPAMGAPTVSPRDVPSAALCALDRRTLDFSALPTSASSGRIPLVRNIPVAHASAVIAALRIHAATIPAGAAMRFDVLAVAPTDEDPAQDFIGPIVASFEVLPSIVAPGLQVSPLGQRSGTHVSIYVTAARGGTGGTFKVMASLAFRPIEGGTAWSPLDLGAKLRLWLDQRDQVAVSGAVSDWGDQSAAGNDFTQATAGSRPSAAGLVNQEAAPDFDGTNDFLGSAALSSFASASAYHAFVVVRAQTVSANNGTSYLNNPVLADGGAGWWGIFLRNNAGTLQTLGFHWDTTTGERVATATGLALNVDTLIELSFDGATMRCQVAGNAEGTTSATAIADLTNPMRIGTGATGAPFLDGVVAAAVVCNQYLSTPERTAVRAYLSSRYGVPA